MTVRAFDTRRIAAYAAVVVFMGLLLAAGCSSDVTDPTYPDPPENPVGVAFLGIWGSGPDDVWAVGQPGLIYHWDGASWERQTSPTTASLTSVWGDDQGNVYITGHGGVILRNTGGGWNTMGSATSENLYDVNSYQGTVMACGFNGTVTQLDGSNWSLAPDEVFVRDAEQAVIDTLYLGDPDDDLRIESLTSVSYYGITGADGAVLMEDPETAWQLRRVTGGADWVTCSASNERVAGNFIGTDDGRLFQLGETDGRLVWNERPSPARGVRVYGIHAGAADTVWAVTYDGRVTRIEPGNGTPVPLYEDGLSFYDIWGSSGADMYAVGIEGRIVHFHEVNPGEFGWETVDLPDLPDKTAKSGAPNLDKFGRPVP